MWILPIMAKSAKTRHTRRDGRTRLISSRQVFIMLNCRVNKGEIRLLAQWASGRRGKGLPSVRGRHLHACILPEVQTVRDRSRSRRQIRPADGGKV